MAERLDCYWRIFATAICFATFGMGGVLGPALVFPMLRLLIRAQPERARAARWIIHRWFRLFVALMGLVGVLTYEVRGVEKLRRRGLLVLANHPSLIDVVFLISFIERADCIVKGALMRNPFTRGPVQAAGFVTNDTGAEVVEECVASVRSGNNLIVFPEGTRTPLHGAPRLQRGAANIAVRGRRDITPVRIACTPPVLTKGAPWYRVPARRPHFVIEICDDIPIRDFVMNTPGDALAVRRLTDYLSDYFFVETRRAPT